MRPSTFLACCLMACCAATPPASAAERMAFWNLTSATVTRLTLAPTGTAAFGPDQCANDRDGTVDHDERLTLTGIAPGRYDVQLATKATPTKPVRACTIRNVEVKAGGKYAFSLQDSDLTDCK